MCINPKRYIFTGMPGSGKTSVINDLAARGFIVVHEAATDIILQEQAKGVEKPWEAPGFIDAVVTLQKTRQQATYGFYQFYDRSPYCTYALVQYLAMEKNNAPIVSLALQQELTRCDNEHIYQKRVFFFDHMGDVEQTTVRQMSLQDALTFERIHEAVYQKAGFQIVRVPAMSVEQRVNFILHM